MNITKNKKKVGFLNRGFSLVELMVVVAIMGTLATIAIPSYKKYRQNARKNGLKSDGLALHKGWLAFGVETDNYCENENGNSANIKEVGMQALLLNGVYGAGSDTELDIVTCSNCTNSVDDGSYLEPHTCDSNCSTATNTDAIKKGHPKIKPPNFIGFADASAGCTATKTSGTKDTNSNPTGIGADQYNNATITTLSNKCNLDSTEYDLGVVGYIGGNTWGGFSITHTGVVTELNDARSPTTVSAVGCK